jgi:TPR repeat protein
MADEGEASSQVKMGICFWYGKGVAQSYPEAIRYFQMAADQNHWKAFKYREPSALLGKKRTLGTHFVHAVGKVTYMHNGDPIHCSRYNS